MLRKGFGPLVSSAVVCAALVAQAVVTQAVVAHAAGDEGQNYRE